MSGFQKRAAADGMLSVAEAQVRVMNEISALGTETITFTEAAGRVLREAITAASDAPEGDNSAMDGYAVRAADVAGAEAETPVRLEVIEDIPAGRVAAGEVRPGTAMRIMTGALLPAGADAVVQVEWTDAGSERVSVLRPVSRGANVRHRGEDMRKGEIVLEPGRVIGPAEIAILASQQKRQVVVGRCPTVAILSTGDELVEVTDERRPGTIVNTNSHLLGALVEQAGAIPKVSGIVRDSREETIRAFREALDADFIVSTGGVSVGAYDFVKEALEALGAETKFWRVAMKPGKPVVLSRLQDRVCFGLPGNPVSCFVSFHLFVAPALRKAMGQTRGLFPASAGATLTSPLRRAGDRPVYYRVHVTSPGGTLQARPLAAQGSGSLTSMIDANGLALVERGEGSVAAGDRVEVLLLGPIAAA